MTGFMCSHMRHKCAADGCYLDQLPSWDDIIECFPGKIRPTDVDGFVEINGRFLFLEEKRKGALIEFGQHRALTAIARLPEVTAIFFRPGATADLDVLIFNQGMTDGWAPYSRPQFLAWLNRWAVEAQNGSAA